MLGLVREAVEALVRDGHRMAPPGNPLLSSRRCGAFVSLFIEGELRGCVGVLEPSESLDRTLVHCAIAAASEDRRFRPVLPQELAGLRYEISLISPLRPVPSAEQVQVGRHGVLVQAGGRQGLLLPQVAVEHRWDLGTFLQQACRKAGLPADAWKGSDARLFVFTAEIVGDKA